MSYIVSQSIAPEDMLTMQYLLYDATNENNPADKWLSEALTGKLNQCYKKMRNEWVPKLMDDSSVSGISASKAEFIHQVVSHSSYTTRYQQESSSYPF